MNQNGAVCALHIVLFINCCREECACIWGKMYLEQLHTALHTKQSSVSPKD